MALINCKECGFRISDKASICVHCGAPVPAPSPGAAPAPPKKKAKPWRLWGTLMLLILGGVLVFGFMNGLDKVFEDLIAFTPQKAETVAPARSEILVSAIRLFKDYKSNEISADMSYKGERLLVNGVIDLVHKNPAGTPYVTISGGGTAKTVHAQFPKSALAQLSPLKRGQNITVACTGGGMLTGSPILQGCTLPRAQG